VAAKVADMPDEHEKSASIVLKGKKDPSVDHAVDSTKSKLDEAKEKAKAGVCELFSSLVRTRV
jgi:hypothetical protein